MSRLEQAWQIGRDDQRLSKPREREPWTPTAADVGRSGSQEDKAFSPIDGSEARASGRPADFGRGSWRISMHTIGVLLLAAATAGDGFGYRTRASA